MDPDTSGIDDTQPTEGPRIFGWRDGKPHVYAIDTGPTVASRRHLIVINLSAPGITGPATYWAQSTGGSETKNLADDPGILLDDAYAAGVRAADMYAVGVAEPSGGMRGCDQPVTLWAVHADDSTAAAIIEHAAARRGINPHTYQAIAVRDLLAAGGHRARHIARATAIITGVTSYSVDPRTGAALTWDTLGTSATTTPHGRPVVFTRTNPCVIGLVTCDSDVTQASGAHDPYRRGDTQRILLAKDRHRSAYFSLIAGYVDPGETLEHAMVREVYEETGLTATGVRYVRSAPWPASSSLMVGMTVTVADTTPTYRTDGELIDTQWVTRQQLGDHSIALPGQGSIARALIDDFIAGTVPFPQPGSLPDWL